MIGCIGALGYIDPAQNLSGVVALSVAIALFSATQDIAIDAYRRELLPDEELGLGNSVHVQAYRIAGLVPGSLALILADQLPWVWVFWVTAGFMLVGVLLSLSISEPDRAPPQNTGFKATVLEPFQEYGARRGWRGVTLILFFMVAFKLGDNMATALAMPFYSGSWFHHDRDRFSGQARGTVALHRRWFAGRAMDAEAGYQSFTLDFRPHSDDQYPRIRSLGFGGPRTVVTGRGNCI